MKLSRRDILQKAYDECMTEMYAKAQPSADYNKIIEDLRNGVSDDSQDDPIYQRHYLSHEEFNYIKDKYIEEGKQLWLFFRNVLIAKIL
jgi:hypothetical protein